MTIGATERVHVADTRGGGDGTGSGSLEGESHVSHVVGLRWRREWAWQRGELRV
jgi:hypothetical protein